MEQTTGRKLATDFERVGSKRTETYWEIDVSLLTVIVFVLAALACVGGGLFWGWLLWA